MATSSTTYREQCAMRERKSSVDLSGHHALCEMNYHSLMRMLPGLRCKQDNQQDSWAFQAGSSSSTFRVQAHVLEAAPYTTTIVIQQDHDQLDSARFVIRMYHDVQMAEIVSWDQHRHWLPQYSYPNQKMYHRDEKLSLNQFLHDWLSFYTENGRKEIKNVMQFT